MNVSKVNSGELIGRFVDLYTTKVKINGLKPMTEYHLNIQSNNQFSDSEKADYFFTTEGIILYRVFRDISIKYQIIKKIRRTFY